jgi:hypothetical protein
MNGDSEISDAPLLPETGRSYFTYGYKLFALAEDMHMMYDILIINWDMAVWTLICLSVP